MELIVLGCSGSVAGPESAASGYFLRGSSGENVLLDMGPGVLAAIQRTPEVDPSQCHVIFSHMHADHCLDFPSLLVWRRYHPTAPATVRHKLIGPQMAQIHLQRAGGDYPDQPDNIEDTFDVLVHQVGEGDFDATIWPVYEVGELRVFSAPAVHTTESYLTRIQDSDGTSIVYTGDTAPTDVLPRFARGADLLVCEATWGECGGDKPEGMHMAGCDAGKAAREAGVKTLLLTHIPPWGDEEATFRGARSEFEGEILIAKSGMKLIF
ncbi:MBL fold metallo-hydrolase [Corynebacterium anserum]|uniref:MBL fold metallo-hydrolase n=1 Tax=Corynebacterium anserum TaxID=2684406 RepID=A0A7G7YMF7_9CORY|nr:MBL fold metallo-hydrolase [Corynebacterium anserum]QNH95677.1 MBL fold metallo-hydrolase [Corynebacterium anserum]